MTQWIIVMDVETTGLEAHDRVCEVAAVPVVGDPPVHVVGRGVTSLVNPGIPIPPQASAIHHLVDEDVQGAPTLAEALDQCFDGMEGGDDEAPILAAHNAPFDRGMLPPLKDFQWIDTYRCSLHLWPEAPSHSNQALRYWRGVKVRGDRGEGGWLRHSMPHSALFDAYTTAALLVEMLKERTPEDLLRLSETPVLLHTCRLPAHKGKPWSEVPYGYLRWAAGQRDPGWDADTQHTIEHHLERIKATPAIRGERG